MSQPIHLLYQSIDGQPRRLLGAVIDPDELAALQNDPDAIPPGGALYEARGVVVDGEVYVLADPKLRDAFPEAVPTFTRAKYDARVAARDAAIASLTKEVRDELFPDWKPEAQLVAERKAEREARLAEDARRRAVAKGSK